MVIYKNIHSGRHKNKKVKLHEKLMKTAILFSVVFLVLYVAYHMTSTSTKFEGVGAIKIFYYFILISQLKIIISFFIKFENKNFVFIFQPCGGIKIIHSIIFIKKDLK